MRCQNCGTVLPDGTISCPECGADLVAPPVPAATPTPLDGQPSTPKPRKRRAGLIVGAAIGLLVLFAGAVIAVVLLLPSAKTTSTSPAYAPVSPDVSAETTTAIDTTNNTAAEDVVSAFYAAINASDFTAASALVATDTKSSIDKGAFTRWSKTTIQVARSTVDADFAEVFAVESKQQFGSDDRGVKFTLQRVSGKWLIESWMPVSKAVLNGTATASEAGHGTDTLNDTTVRDVVSSLLQARQGGDAQSIRLLTTAKFQSANAAVWLDGVDNTPYFTAFSIKSVEQKGSAFIVTVTEQWNSGAETATYTVVDQGGAILVDAWSSK